MIGFEDRGNQLVLVYESDQGSVAWADDKLRTDGKVTFSRTFTLRSADLLSSDEDDDLRSFVVGTVGSEYRTIRASVLGLRFDLRIAKSIALTRSTFIAERNISIFRRIDDLAEEPIIVGGSDESAIPEVEFFRLLREFPTSGEVNRYAAARVSRVLREYMETMSDAESKLALYMERRKRVSGGTREPLAGRIGAASELELEKFTYVRDQLVEMLRDAEGYPEARWQAAVADLFLLIFPQYVAVLHNVQVKEWYSNAAKSTDRFIDLMLVSANGCVDIIEIKKPFERGLVSKRPYRDNFVPVRELSGSIMQAEKYLFYLSKSGHNGEAAITKKYAGVLPEGLAIRISNPKAFILSGRDHNLTDQENRDLEFARRMYSNVVDIISYDDLLRRLDNVIAALMKRAAHTPTATSSRGAEVLHD